MRSEGQQATREWAYEEFGHAELGDTRRTDRIVRMVAALAEQPGGKVLDVFRSGAERQAAYDLLANPHVRQEAMLAATEAATVRRCASAPWVHVVVDGTSLRLPDWKRKKDFGAVGSTLNGARGLKVIHAYAVSADGTPIGVLNQQWWTRIARKKRTDCQDRPLAEKETLHWVRSIGQATRALVLGGSRAWFQVDREGDRYWTLAALHRAGQRFTVRSTYAHRFVEDNVGRRRRLRDVARKGKLRGIMSLDIPERIRRKGRTARLRIRTATVTLDMVEAHSEQRLALPVSVVDVLEVGTTPRGEKPLHWRLLTNAAVASMRDVLAVVDGYTKRWRIEELHRVWKSGALRVEETQLRSASRVIKWAILAVVTAARIERLRVLARTRPDDSALGAFTEHELDALILMKRRHAKRTETIPDKTPTIAQAVRWLADLGGYAGHKSSGRPGAVTLRRGLQYITPVAAALEVLKAQGKL
jgi:Transposase DNA-binding/Transposase Tn5 dimerisation domain